MTVGPSVGAVRRPAQHDQLNAAVRPAAPVTARSAHAQPATETLSPRYRYWPVLATVSIDRPASVPLAPVTRVRM